MKPSTFNSSSTRSSLVVTSRISVALDSHRDAQPSRMRWAIIIAALCLLVTSNVPSVYGKAFTWGEQFKRPPAWPNNPALPAAQRTLNVFIQSDPTPALERDFILKDGILRWTPILAARNIILNVSVGDPPPGTLNVIRYRWVKNGTTVNLDKLLPQGAIVELAKQPNIKVEGGINDAVAVPIPSADRTRIERGEVFVRNNLLATTPAQQDAIIRIGQHEMVHVLGIADDTSSKASVTRHADPGADFSARDLDEIKSLYGGSPIPRGVVTKIGGSAADKFFQYRFDFDSGGGEGGHVGLITLDILPQLVDRIEPPPGWISLIPKGHVALTDSFFAEGYMLDGGGNVPPWDPGFPASFIVLRTSVQEASSDGLPADSEPELNSTNPSLTFTVFTLDNVLDGDIQVWAGGDFQSVSGPVPRTFIVNSTADADDGDHGGDGLCDIGSNNPLSPNFPLKGICTLRAALLESEFTPFESARAPNVIQFNIPGDAVPTIQVDPDLSFNVGRLGALRPVIIDGTTQSAGAVELDGSSAAPEDAAGNPIVGLDFVGENILLRGLVIQNFPSHGVFIRPTGAPFGGKVILRGNVIQNNGGDGVRIFQMPNNIVAGNSIRGNTGQGITAEGPDATGNRFLNNFIDSNGGLGIQLSGGANNLQQPPALTSAISDGPSISMQGTLVGPAEKPFTLEFFANASPDPSGSGEGATFVGSTEAMTDVVGSASFTASFLADGPVGPFMTATATDSDGNTSEFSAALAVSAPANQAPVLDLIGDRIVDEGSLLSFTATASDPDTPAQVLSFSLDAGAPAAASIDPSTGEFAFTPSDGPATYVLTVRVTDNGLPALNDSETFMITVKNVAPTVAAGSDQTVNVGSPVTLNGSFTDPGADTHIFNWHVIASNGPVIADGASLSFSFTPTAPGTYTATLTVTDEDGGMGSDSVTVIAVQSANHAPNGKRDKFKTIQDTQLAVPAPGVLGNDDDRDGDSLIAVLVSGPKHGSLTLNGDGSFLYTPDSRFRGQDTFSYHASDGIALSKVIKVMIQVRRVK